VTEEYHSKFQDSYCSRSGSKFLPLRFWSVAAWTKLLLINHIKMCCRLSWIISQNWLRDWIHPALNANLLPLRTSSWNLWCYFERDLNGICYNIGNIKWMKWEPSVFLPTMWWCFSTWNPLSYLDCVEFNVHCVYRAAHFLHCQLGRWWTGRKDTK